LDGAEDAASGAGAKRPPTYTGRRTSPAEPAVQSVDRIIVVLATRDD
jgi:hypothetical protein